MGGGEGHTDLQRADRPTTTCGSGYLNNRHVLLDTGVCVCVWGGYIILTAPLHNRCTFNASNRVDKGERTDLLVAFCLQKKFLRDELVRLLAVLVLTPNEQINFESRISET